MKFCRIFEKHFPMYYSFPFHILGQPRYSLPYTEEAEASSSRRRRWSVPRESFSQKREWRQKGAGFPARKVGAFCETSVKATQTYGTNRKKKSFLFGILIGYRQFPPQPNPSLLLLRTSIREICGKQKLLLFCLSSGEEVKVPLSYLVSFQRLSFRCVNVRTVSMYSCLVSWLCFKVEIWARLPVKGWRGMQGNYMPSLDSTVHLYEVACCATSLTIYFAATP